MSAPVADLVARLRLDSTQFAAGLSAATGAVEANSRRMVSTGRTMTRRVTMPLVAIGAAATVMSLKYEEAFVHMVGLAGVPEAEIAGLNDQILKLSHDTAQAPVALANAMYFIQSSGIKGAAAMQTLDVSARAATAGLGSVETVADAVTSALNAYGTENLTAATAANVLVGAVREGKGEVGQLAGSLGRIIPVASNLGVSFQQVGAGMAGLTRIGLSAAESATALRAIMMSLLGPSDRAQQVLASVGESAGSIRQKIADEGLLTTLLDLKEKLGGNAAAMNTVFGNVRALNGVMSLIGANADEVSAIFDNLTGDTQYLAEAFNTVAATDGFKLKQSFADVQVALIQLGDTIVPVVARLAGAFAQMASGVGNLPGPVRSVVVGVLAFAAAAGPALVVSGALVNAWRTLAGSAAQSAAATTAAAQANTAAATTGAAAAGRISTGGLAMIGITGTLVAAAGVMRLFADDTRNTTGIVDAFSLAIQSSGDALDGLTAAMQAMRPDEAAAGADELARAMDAAGLSADDLGAALNGPQAGLDDFARQLADTGVITERELSNIDKGFNALFDSPFTTATEIVPTSAFDRTRNALGDLQTSMQGATATQEALNATGLDTSGADAAAAGFEGLDVAADDARASVEALNSAWSELNGVLSASNAELAARDSLRSLADAVKAAGEDGSTTAAEFDGIHRSVNDLAGALMKQAEAANTAADGTVNANAANRDLRTSMEYLLAAGSIPEALRGDWQALIDTIAATPGDVTIDTSAPGATTAQDQLLGVYLRAVAANRRVEATTSAPGSHAAAADLNAVKAAADRVASRVYPAHVRTLVERRDFDRLVADLDAADNRRFSMQVSVTRTTRNVEANAVGTGSAPPGLSWVGERGPELVNFRGGEAVYNNPQSLAKMRRLDTAADYAPTAASGGRSGDTYMINLTLTGAARKSDGQPLIDALVEWQRRNGAVPIRTKG